MRFMPATEGYERADGSDYLGLALSPCFVTKAYRDASAEYQ